MITEKLFYSDAYISSFDATVISCVKTSDMYQIILDKTAFFFEGGGQKADTGFIGEAKVVDVQEINGEIVHIADIALEEGTVYSCRLDWNARFRRMQQHGGEHIVSGIVHSLYGYSNVGFPCRYFLPLQRYKERYFYICSRNPCNYHGSLPKKS